MLVRECMTRDVLAVSPDDSAARARAALERRGVRQAPVSAKGRLVGVVSRSDLAAAPEAALVHEVMASPVLTVGPHTAIDEAAYLLRKHKVRSLIVVDRHRIVGILSVSDILDAFVRLSGIQEPTYRISLAAGANLSAALVRALVHRHHGNLKWLHAEAGGKRRTLHLRVRARRIGDLLTALEGAGFEVTAVVAPGPTRRAAQVKRGTRVSQE